MADEQDPKPLWERQPWDTKESFVAFKIYLMQKPPRYLLRAYKLYREEKEGLSKAEVKKIINVPDCWDRWAKGLNGRNQPIPGAATWEDRGHAYDDQVLWPARMKDWANRSWQLVEAMADKSAAMLEYPITETTVKEVDENGRPVVYIITPNKRWNYRTAAALANQSDKQARLNLGKPTSHTAVSQGPDYSELSHEELQDAIRNKLSQLGSIRDVGLISPSFGGGETNQAEDEG